MNKSRNPIAILVLVAFFAAAALFTVMGFMFMTALPPLASQHGAKVDTLIYYLMATTGAVFLIGNGSLCWLIWMQSRDGAVKYRPISARTEVLWALGPVGIMAVISEVGVLVLGLPVWNELYGQTNETVMNVEVVGKQFEWFVRYPGKDGKFGKTDMKRVRETSNYFGLVEEDPEAEDDILARGVLRVPINRTILVRLRSHDVQHSFYVPSFRLRQDLVPGMITQTRFKATKLGEYEIACSQLCGLGHYKMNGKVIVMPEIEFDEWLSKQKGYFQD